MGSQPRIQTCDTAPSVGLRPRLPARRGHLVPPGEFCACTGRGFVASVSWPVAPSRGGPWTVATRAISDVCPPGTDRQCICVRHIFGAARPLSIAHHVAADFRRRAHGVAENRGRTTRPAREANEHRLVVPCLAR